MRKKRVKDPEAKPREAEFPQELDSQQQRLQELQKSTLAELEGLKTSLTSYVLEIADRPRRVAECISRLLDEDGPKLPLPHGLNRKFNAEEVVDLMKLSYHMALTHVVMALGHGDFSGLEKGRLPAEYPMPEPDLEDMDASSLPEC